MTWKKYQIGLSALIILCVTAACPIISKEGSCFAACGILGAVAMLALSIPMFLTNYEESQAINGGLENLLLSDPLTSNCTGAASHLGDTSELLWKYDDILYFINVQLGLIYVYFGCTGIQFISMIFVIPKVEITSAGLTKDAVDFLFKYYKNFN